MNEFFRPLFRLWLILLPVVLALNLVLIAAAVYIVKLIWGS